MRFVISRDTILKPLNWVAGVVERRQTLPILANVLLSVENDRLTVTGTDLETELVVAVSLEEPAASPGAVTLPARKLVDICKSLPEGAQIEIAVEEQRATLRSGRSGFTLSTLPVADFPKLEDPDHCLAFELERAELRKLIDRTAFAMAQQDVRYYLNGMLWELGGGRVRAVATDGHRLALCSVELPALADAEVVQVILPRKAVGELSRLLQEEGESVHLAMGSRHFRAETPEFCFTSKLVEGRFPDYERVLPRACNRTILGDRERLRQAFHRVSILAHEKYRGVRIQLDAGQMSIMANNPDQEEAREEVVVQFEGEPLEIGFTVSSLIDVMDVLVGSEARIELSDANSSALIAEHEGAEAMYVVMPMRL